MVAAAVIKLQQAAVLVGEAGKFQKGGVYRIEQDGVRARPVIGLRHNR